MRKILLLLIFLLTICLVGCQNDNTVDNRPTLIVGMECGYPPFNWTENTKTKTNYPIEGTSLYAEGYDVQIAKKIADELDCRLVIKAIEWNGLISALETNQIDLIIAGMSNTEERRQSVQFTNHYYQSTHVLVMAQDSKFVNGISLSDFEGANVVGQLETLYDSLIDQLVGVNHMTPLEDVPTIIASINAKRADITILEEPVAKGILETNPTLTYIKLTEGFIVSEEDTCVAIALRKGENELCDQINSVLSKISEDERTQLMDQAISNNAK